MGIGYDFIRVKELEWQFNPQEVIKNLDEMIERINQRVKEVKEQKLIKSLSAPKTRGRKPGSKNKATIELEKNGKVKTEKEKPVRKTRETTKTSDKTTTTTLKNGRSSKDKIVDKTRTLKVAVEAKAKK